jgi:hypothetical protein
MVPKAPLQILIRSQPVYFRSASSTSNSTSVPNIDSSLDDDSTSQQSHGSHTKFEKLNSWKGTVFHEDDEATSFTVCFNNVNGLRRHGTSLREGLKDLVSALQMYNVSVCGISEHHLAMHHTKIRQQLHETTQSLRVHSPILCNFHSSQDKPTLSDRLMGGTGLVALGDAIGRIEYGGRGGDPLGRWSYFHVKRIRQPPVTIISVYQVCHTPTNEIGTTAWHQQRRALDRDNRHHVHPRTAFLEDITAFIQRLQTDKHAVIVGGDWNDYIDSTNSSVLRLCTSLNLVDPWIHHYPHLPTFPNAWMVNIMYQGG